MNYERKISDQNVAYLLFFTIYDFIESRLNK